ncbi:MAG: phosphoribosylanthranilate isomerase [Desulfamplus sp.]|nr:phosphoribosylanthranilate isomerase [Desulfamplus sp.]
MIKICGLTSPDQALACVKAGADAIGFIFFPKSPRYISPELAARITEKLPENIMTTGVFVDEDYKSIMKAVKTSSLKAVQLHGNESPSLVRLLAKEGLIVIKALFAGKEPHLSQAHLYGDAHALLVEYGKGELPGGNGESWNWELVRQMADKAEKESGEKESGEGNDKRKKQRIILAGGLTPDNIEKAIKMANPWGIDVSSGVEFSPGQKDIVKVEKLIDQLR